MSESKFQYIDEEKEMSGEEYSDSEEEESPTNNETEVEAESTETPETEEEKKLKVGDNEFDSVEELLKFAEERDKSYSNLQSLNGRQTNELGDLRKMVEELKDSMEPQQEPEAVPEFDEYDPAKQKEYIEFMAAKKAQDMIAQRFQAEEAKTEYNSAMDAMMNDFIEKHPELDKVSLEKIAAFGDERGITFIEDAYNVWNIQNQPVKDEAKSQVDKAKKATEATKIPTTLSNVSTGNESDTDYDNLTPEQWSNLSDDVRKKALMEVSSGF